MILYHGSDINIEEINLSLCNPNKDFGRGFYLTEKIEDAKSLAKQRATISGRPGTINVYEFDASILVDTNLKIKVFKEYSLEWAEFVFRNRRGDDVEKFDIVYVPIADDRVGAQIARYAEGFMSAEEFLNRIKYFKGVTYQYFFGTEKAISFLNKMRHEYI